MTADRNSEVEDAVKHFKDGNENRDLSQFIQDLQKDEQSRGTADKTFEQAVTARLHQEGLLPQVNFIDGVDGKGNLLMSHKDGRKVAVEADGDVVLQGRVQRTDVADRTSQRGDPRTERPEGATRPADSHIARDDAGRVSKVEYPSNGKSQEFTRDAQGEIVKVKNEDQESWSKQQDGSWKMDGSEPPINWKGKLYTSESGDFVKEHADGRKDVEKSDGSTVSYDKDGRLSRTEDASGKIRDYKYEGASKTPSEITGPGQESFKTTDGGKTWSHNGAAAAELDVKVGQDGSVSYKSGEGRNIENANGSEVHVNGKDQVTRIEDAKGKVFEFGYDAAGKLNNVKNEHGTWNSTDGHGWTNEKGQKWEGKIGVDKEGNYWYEADGGKRTHNRPDGTKDVDTRPEQTRTGGDTPQRPGDTPQRPGDKPPEPRVTEGTDGRRVTEYPDGFKVSDYRDGSQCETNDKGQCTYARSKEGLAREFHYNGPPPDGKVGKVEGMDGSTWMNVPPGSKSWRSDRGQSWQGDVSVDENGNAHYKPVRGQPFALTREGQVVPEGGQSGDAHSRHRPGGQQGDRPGQPGQPGDRPGPQPGQPGDQPGQPRETPEQQKQRETQERAAEERKKGPLIKPEILFPKKGVYNPAGPPGVGDSQPGTAHEDEKAMGDGNLPIDWRTVQPSTDKDGNTVHKYEGEIADGGLLPWNWGDTNFTGSETWTKDGRLLERTVEYEDGVDLKFQKPGGKEEEISDVTKVETKYNPQTGNLDTVVTTEDGTKYRAETAQDGSVKSFEKVTGETQAEAPGDASKAGNKGNFSPSDGHYNPVRPQGIGEWNPGQAGGDKAGIDNRESKAETNPDGSTTYRYDGEIEDSGLMPWNWGDSNFKAEETVDKQGNIVGSKVEYNSAVDQKYVGPNGEAVPIEDVKSVTTKRDQSGNYVTEVKDDDGKVWKFTTDPSGKVTGLQRPK